MDDCWIGQASGAPGEDPGWYFTGRRPVMRQVVHWLDDQWSGSLLIVTGARGTGKSAVLGWTVTLSDRGFRTDARYRQLVEAVPPGLMPPDGAVDASVDARGRSTRRVADLLLDALGVTPPGGGSVRERLAAGLVEFSQWHGRAACVVVDAVDEAVDPTALVQEVLTALTLTVLPDGGPACRALVGVRHDPTHDVDRLASIEALTPDHLTVRTDLAQARAEVAVYCTRLLSRDYPPYRPRPDLVEQVVAWASRQETPSFLNARIVCEALSRGVEVDLAAFEGGLVDQVLPVVLQAALDQQSKARPAADCYMAALRALAFARGAGTPWGQVWPAMAAAVADRATTGQPGLTWDEVVAQVLRGPLGAFVMTATEDDQRVFRPAHAAITDALKDPTDTAAVEARIARALSALVPDLDPPDPYVRRHLVAHAAAGGTLTDPVVPRRFLPWETSGTVRGHLGLPLPDDPQTRTLTAWAAVEPHLEGIPTVEERELALRFQLLGPADDLGWRTWMPNRNVLVALPTGTTLTCLSFGQVGGRTLLATGSDEGTVRLWDPTTGQAGPPLQGHHDDVWSVAFGQVGGRTLLATGSRDGTVRLWDPTTGQAGPPLEGHHDDVWSVAFGQVDGHALLATGSDDGTARLWDPTTGQPVGPPLEGHDGWVRSVAFGQVDGRTLLATGSHDRTARLWDPTTGQPVGPPLEGHQGWVWSVAFGQVDGRALLATGSGDRTARLWDPTTGQPVGPPLEGHQGGVWSVAFGQVDGRTLLATGSTDRTARLWDPTTGQPVGPPLQGHHNMVLSVAFGQVDGRTLLATGSGDGTARLWDPTPGQPVGQPFEGHDGWVLSVAFGQVDGHALLATGSDDGTVRLWDPTTGQPVGQPLEGHDGGVWSVAFGQVDGRTLLATGSHDDTARLWDPTTGQPVGQPLEGHDDWVLSVAFGQVDGRTLLATGSYDGTARLWDPTTGQPVGQPLEGHHGEVWSVAFGQVDGHALLVTGSDDRTARLWDPTTGPYRRHLRRRRSPRQPVGQPFEGHHGGVRSVAFGQVDGRTLLATGSDDGTARLWDPTTGQPVGPPLEGHHGGVLSVAFGQVDGRTLLATSGHDGTARLWDPTTSRPVWSLTCLLTPVLSLSLADDGRLAVGTASGVAVLTPEFFTVAPASPESGR